MICYRCATPIPDDSRFCLSCGADVSGATSGERTQPLEVDRELQAKLQEDLGGDFTIERQLGRGGMAAVFLARETHLERPVAIKVLPPELTYGQGMIERFKREAKVAATLDHPHIIPIHRVSTGGKIFWYAMKYLEGASLSDIIQGDAPLPVLQVADVLEQVAEALDYAHERGVIHRDVKPANVMIDAKGWATVTDFGIAKAATQSSMTGSGSMIGTPYFMSPEQCSGKKITGASDQYSLGVMAFQMLTGHLPFTGETVIEIVKKHCTDPVPPMAVLRPDLSPELVGVVERALAKSPEVRFPSTGEFALAFAAAAQIERSRGSRLTARGAPGAPRRRSITADVSPVPGPRGATAARPAKTGHRRVIALVVTAVIALAAGGAALLWQLNARSPSAPPSAGPTASATAAPEASQPRPAPESPPQPAVTPNAGDTSSVPVPPAGAGQAGNGQEQASARQRASTRRPRQPGSPTVRTPRRTPPVETSGRGVPPPARAAAGSVYVWSNPPIAFSILGRSYQVNPQTVPDLPAGSITIRFEATESTTAYEKTVQVLPGRLVRTGRITLPRKP